MISFSDYKAGRDKYIEEMENIPLNEIDFLLDLAQVDITKPLPQIKTTVYSSDRTPFIRDHLSQLSQRSIKKIKDKFKELGWGAQIGLEYSPPDHQNISFKIKLTKLKN